MYDSWLDDGFHFFVFLLASDGNGASAAEKANFAVFAMHPESPDPVSAITVVPKQSGTEAEITNLQPPGGSYFAPFPLHEELEARDNRM